METKYATCFQGNLSCCDGISRVWKSWQKVVCMREGRLDSLPFRFQASSSETTICNIPLLWPWAIRSQWLWVLLSLPIIWGRKERLKQCQSLQDSLAPWSLDAVELAKWLRQQKYFWWRLLGLLHTKMRRCKIAEV